MILSIWFNAYLVIQLCTWCSHDDNKSTNPTVTDEKVAPTPDDGNGQLVLVSPRKGSKHIITRCSTNKEISWPTNPKGCVP
jgi:hypothetical protein